MANNPLAKAVTKALAKTDNRGKKSSNQKNTGSQKSGSNDKSGSTQKSGTTQKNNSNQKSKAAPKSGGQRSSGGGRNNGGSRTGGGRSAAPAKTEQNAKNAPKRRRTSGGGKDKLKVIPLGGLGEIGKNLTVFEYKDQMIIVDCGLKFPDDDMFGIDIVLPDFTYLVENQHKIQGLFVTHGHEDHIGGIAYLLKKLDRKIPIYTTKFTMGMIDKKLNEHVLTDRVDRRITSAGDTVTVGHFSVEFIRVNHSVADSVAFFIKSPAATVFHTGDFKIDYQPIDGEIIDLQRIAEIGGEGVDLLLSDSTNVEEAGFNVSESSVGETFYNLFRGSKNRIIVTTFASNIHRIQQIVNAALAYNRKVVINGRSMENNVEVAMDLGYLNIPKSALIDIKDMKNYKDSEIVVITTGSQGEPMAALGRMAQGEHRFLNIKKDDMIIISASPVPGNEKMVSEIINKLTDLGSNVVYKKFADIHVSGHAKREELKLILTLIRPRFFMPVHGEARMLLHHSALAEQIGRDKRNTIIGENGSIVEVDHNNIRIAGKVQIEQVLVDGLGVGDIGNIVLNDRKRLSEDGLFIVVVMMNKGRAVSSPDIISRGFVYVRESEELMGNARDKVKNALLDCEKKGITEWSSIKNEIRYTLERYLYAQTNRKPMILPILMEV